MFVCWYIVHTYLGPDLNWIYLNWKLMHWGGPIIISNTKSQDSAQRWKFLVDIFRLKILYNRAGHSEGLRCCIILWGDQIFQLVRLYVYTYKLPNILVSLYVRTNLLDVQTYSNICISWKLVKLAFELFLWIFCMISHCLW